MNIAQNWRMNGLRYGLIGTIANRTGAIQLIPREVTQEKLPTPFTFEPSTVIELEAPHELRQAAR
jgi:hypothetical protein